MDLARGLDTLLAAAVVAALAPVLVALLPGPRIPQVVVLLAGTGWRLIVNGGGSRSRGGAMSDNPEHVHEPIEEEAGPPGLAGYRDREHQAHPEGGGGADLGHVHDAIEEEER